jgi:hypothetical protein
MQTKHTPGPWHIGVRTFHAGRDVYGPKGEPVAVADDAITATPEAEANARLIAAAPCLLACLEALVGEADLGEVDLDDDDRAKLEQARAAIAKATGGQP